MADEKKETNLRTMLVRISYPTLITPRAQDPDPETQAPRPPQYGATLIIDERSKGVGNGGGLTPVNAELNKKLYGTYMPEMIKTIGLLAQGRFPNEFKGDGAPYFPAQAWKSPWIDGGAAAYSDKKGLGAGTWFIRPNSMRVIPVADRRGQAADPSIIYPGCYAYAVLSTFVYSNKKKHGVSFGLRGLQFVEDGERLDDAVDLADYFPPLEGDELPADGTEDALRAMFSGGKA